MGGPKLDSSKFYSCEKSENCTAVLLYVGYIMAKGRMPSEKNSPHTRQNKALNLAG